MGSKILPAAGTYLLPVLSSKKVCVVTDSTIAKLYLIDLMHSLEEAGLNACPPIILPPGESTKNFQQLQYIIDKSLSYKLDRKSALIALGGGVIGDIAGFAAATIMRGISFVQIPTTLLSQVDSSVGGKTGINTSHGKNLVGVFYHPKIVLIDTATLKTLPLREIKAGYAEILKYALINNAAFFTWLEQNGSALLAGDAELQKYAIDVSCRSKAAIVEQDPDEQKDIRVLLNLGHSFAHAMETLGNYDGRLLHGEAVAIGILLAYELSQQPGLCSANDVQRLRQHMAKMQLMTEPPFKVTARDMLERMLGDKKNREGQIT
ncbi:MAG: 3-dehydroquinate synthase, partial [Proteobacteria bacterium]|nr:3-dehydroquinate synthase [Pseudomonadota bacterium]